MDEGMPVSGLYQASAKVLANHLPLEKLVEDFTHIVLFYVKEMLVNPSITMQMSLIDARHALEWLEKERERRAQTK